MNPNDAAKLLAIAAAYDNRKPDATAAQAWALALDGLRFEDCQRAMVEHYRTSAEWMMPVHVIAAVKRARGGRIVESAPIAIPPGFDPDDTEAYLRLVRESRQAQADGREVVEPEPAGTKAIEAGELRALVRSLPRKERPTAADTARSPEHERRMAEVRAELDAKRPPALAHGPVTDPTETEEMA